MRKGSDADLESTSSAKVEEYLVDEKEIAMLAYF